MADTTGAHNEVHGESRGPVVQAGSIHNLWLGVPRSRPKELLEIASRRAWDVVLAPQDSPGDLAVEQLTEDVRELARAQPRLPVDEVLVRVVRAQEAVYSLLEVCRSPVVGRRLHFIAGIVGAMLARAGHECGDARTARLHARAAFRHAEHADHDGLRARVRALQSAVAYWCGQPREALGHARSGAVFAARAGSTMAARLPVSEARAWGMLGDRRAAEAAIARAERAWDRVRYDDLDEFGGVCAFTWSRHLHFAANALTWLPDEAGSAERYATLAVDAYRDRSTAEWAFGSHAGAHIDLTVARLRRHEVEGAAEALAPVLELPPRLRISTVVLAVGRVGRQLHWVPPSTASRDLRERIDAFVRTPLDALSS